MRVLFIRTPRHLWPFNSEASSFWPPLGFAQLAGVLRAAGYKELEILDAPVLKMGWRSLEAELRSRRPQVVCIGEETVSAPEGLRLAAMVREIHGQGVKVIAGGHFFTFMEEYALIEHDVDVVVRHEGEQTLVELLDELQRVQPDLAKVRGIAFLEGDRVVRTPMRPLMEDLDSLPMPAWDLLPMDLYGKGARNHPALGSIEHSRGCTGQCTFCILWRTMGDPESPGIPEGEEVAPCWRTKSPERTMEEVDLLVRGFGRRTLGWVDSTWNVDPGWSDRFCDLMIRSGHQVQSTKWLRADHLLRDEELGVLEKQVRSGMVQAIMGLERPDPEDLVRLKKHGHGHDVATRVARLFRTRYPEVFTIGSFIYGVPEETRESLNRLVDFAHEVDLDHIFFLCLTPNPGTLEWQRARAEGLIEVEDFRSYNLQTPIMSSRTMSRDELQRSIILRNLRAVLVRALKGEFRRWPRGRTERRRTARRALFKHSFRLLFRALACEIASLFKRDSERWSYYSIRPRWYDS